MHEHDGDIAINMNRWHIFFFTLFKVITLKWKQFMGLGIFYTDKKAV